MRPRNLLLFFLLYVHISFAQDSLRVMQYNLLRYGSDGCGPSHNQKNIWLNTLLTTYQPDLLLANELIPNVGAATSLINQSKSYTDNLAVSDIFNSTGSDLENAAFYRSDKLGYLGGESLAADPREISIFQFYLKASLPDTVKLYTIVIHLKASNSSSDRSKRSAAAATIMNWVANHPNENIILGGDFNVKTHEETAFQRFVSNTNASISFIDPIDKVSGWSGSTHSAVHTQSTRSSNVDCGATGGLDDRFDMVLISQSINNGTAGLSYVENSYRTIGNDGDDYNQSLACSTSPSVSSEVCSALFGMSDHLPLMMKLLIRTPTNLRSTVGNNLQVFAQNPLMDELNIFFKEGISHKKSMEIELFDQVGRRLLKEKIVFKNESRTIPVPNLSSGVYMLQVSDGKSSIHQKLIKY